MGTKETVSEKDAAQKKLKLNKETVKNLGVKKGTADVVKGGLSRVCGLGGSEYC